MRPRHPPARLGPGTRSGFSLVELAVVVGVLGLLTMTALSAFDNLGQARRHNAARAHAETARQALHAFALRNKRLPCPDLSGTGDSGFEGSNGACSATGNVGWLPYASLGLELPVRGERLRYGVYRGTANTDLVAPARESADQPDLEYIGGFGSALSRIVANTPTAPQASQPHYISGGTPTQCGSGGTGTRMVNPAFVLVAPVAARDGDGGGGDGGFDGANNRAFAQGNGTCVTPPDYPGDERYDDLVVAESATALLGWLMATTR